MKCETDDLLHAAHDILVAHPVGVLICFSKASSTPIASCIRVLATERTGRGPASLQQWQVIILRHLDNLCHLTQRAEAEGLEVRLR